LELLWNCLVFISDSFVSQNLGSFGMQHHEAVGGFFDAPEGRADNTSFEGGNKSGVPPMRLLDSCHAQARKILLAASGGCVCASD
jgi:hypothetical protein